jgi:hypothetical protein
MSYLLDPSDRSPVALDAVVDALKAKLAELDQVVAEFRRRIEALEQRPWLQINPVMPDPSVPDPSVPDPSVPVEPWPHGPGISPYPVYPTYPFPYYPYQPITCQSNSATTSK